MSIGLWIAQVLLALLFLFAGGAKFVMSEAEMTAGMPVALPVLFIRFIGVLEILGALGLILPGLFRTQTFLTPLAAAGLLIIMIGAVGLTLMMGDPSLIVLPLVTGLVAAFVAYGRWRVAPLRDRAQSSIAHPVA
jgi:hypothetical protein